MYINATSLVDRTTQILITHQREKNPLHTPFFCITIFFVSPRTQEREIKKMGEGVVSCRLQLFFFLLHGLLLSKVRGKGSSSALDYAQCDVFTGTWVVDESYPPYDPATCPFIEREFRCKGNGRPDLLYTRYRWHPLACNLLRLVANPLIILHCLLFFSIIIHLFFKKKNHKIEISFQIK